MEKAKGPRSADVDASEAEQHHPAACDGALSKAFGFLGKRWNGVILATLQHGPLGFAELRRAVEGISDSVLSERLSELSAAGLTYREVEPGPPVTVRYRLTPDGTALMPILSELAGWASRHLPDTPSARRGGRGGSVARRGGAQGTTG
ncbi:MULTISPECIES: helix-turn-helix domain-containing protein [Streptomyces]|uniref:Helix-turn-helix transcriptional regulator n=1 Tax=Streptomyces nigra TaxID=1827580 RepID=A0ABZ1J230_9ACTN|nr:helix-turn-helix domain-containing protein [Streptomyces sp. RK62]MBQ0995500.1 helix-turn-helix transcriptional regulator [Streptomyces sp. RK62]